MSHGPNADSESLTLLFRNKKILVVEDQVIVGLELVMDVGDLGAETTGPIDTVGEAVQLIQSVTHFDGAILDVDIKGEDVFPVADLLTERGVPFVFCTGHGDPKELQSKYSGVPVCIKPTPSLELFALLAQRMASQRPI